MINCSKKILIIYALLIFICGCELGYKLGFDKAVRNLVSTGIIWKEQWKRQCDFIGGKWTTEYEWGDKIKFSCLLIKSD